MVKMKKPGKKRALAASWEGPYRFIGHVDGKGNYDFEEGCRLCIIQDADGRQWERSRRDLQIYHMQPNLTKLRDSTFKEGRGYICSLKLGYIYLCASLIRELSCACITTAWEALLGVCVRCCAGKLE
jgi:hypothetical protein